MKNKNPLRAMLIILAALILGLGISWAATVGVWKILTLCFGIESNLGEITGCWIIATMLVIAFRIRKSIRKKEK